MTSNSLGERQDRLDSAVKHALDVWLELSWPSVAKFWMEISARTPEGKAAVARNAFKGGERPALRQHIREARRQIAAAVAIFDYCQTLGDFEQRGGSGGGSKRRSQTTSMNDSQRIL